jgi:hypothetical protein
MRTLYKGYGIKRGVIGNHIGEGKRWLNFNAMDTCSKQDIYFGVKIYEHLKFLGSTKFLENIYLKLELKMLFHFLNIDLCKFSNCQNFTIGINSSPTAMLNRKLCIGDLWFDFLHSPNCDTYVVNLSSTFDPTSNSKIKH